MRALAGPAMLLVIVGGFALNRACSDPKSPPRSFLDAELAAPVNDDGHAGTCYSLSTVIIANTAYSTAAISWKRVDGDAWELSIEEVVQGSFGPQAISRRFTFEKRDDLVHLVRVAGSEGHDTDVTRNLDVLVRAPNGRSTPVDRCLQPGATGYLFRPRR